MNIAWIDLKLKSFLAKYISYSPAVFDYVIVSKYITEYGQQ